MGIGGKCHMSMSGFPVEWRKPLWRILAVPKNAGKPPMRIGTPIKSLVKEHNPPLNIRIKAWRVGMCCAISLEEN
jgi:hypothetical protein